MKISTTLKQKRIELKLSQNEVAEQLFVTRQTISN
ncbi:helix-turn-helix transcriptional regulator [Carnobacterium sp.]